MFKKTLFAALALAGAMNVQASTTVNLSADSLWQSFSVDDTLSTAANPLAWSDDNGSELSFNFTLSQATTLRVVDAGFSGDVFQVFDNGVSIGFTSAAVNNYVDGNTPTVIDFNTAWANSNFSQGTFLLGTGVHNITGVLSTSALDGSGMPFNATLGAVSLTAVPVPFAGLFMLTGSALLAAVGRRRQSV